MADRFDEMEELIQKFAANEIVGANRIYNELCDYGLSKEEIESKGSLSEEQDKLLKIYRRLPGCSCRMMMENYFLVFTDNLYRKRLKGQEDDPECIKLYVPANKENTYEVASKLFTHFATNLVIHNSKVAKRVRADDIVARIRYEDETKETIDFINGNLSDKIMKPNPFIMRDGAVGVTRDGGLSYNQRVSRFLSDYLSSNQGDMENVGLDGFNQYMQERKEKVFTDKEYIKQLLSSEDRKYYSNGMPDLDYIYDNSIIIEILSMATDKEKGIEDFYEYWRSLGDEQKCKERKKKISDILLEIEQEKSNEKKDISLGEL